MDDAARKAKELVARWFQKQWPASAHDDCDYCRRLAAEIATALRELEAERDAGAHNYRGTAISCEEYEQMQRHKRDALATRLAQVETERDRAVETGLRFLQSGCSRHSEEISRSSFQEFMEKYGRQCVPCLATRLARVEGAAQDVVKWAETSLSYPQCEAYGVAFTQAIADANVAYAEAWDRLKAALTPDATTKGTHE